MGAGGVFAKSKRDESWKDDRGCECCTHHKVEEAVFIAVLDHLGYLHLDRRTILKRIISNKVFGCGQDLAGCV
jgi:hypothetical protein